MLVYAYPAVMLLFGMVYASAAFHLLSLSWSWIVTATVYAIPLLWVVALALWSKRRVRTVTEIDVAFLLLVTAIAVSLLVNTVSLGEKLKYASYLPFMVIAPFLCGRLMRLGDIDVFAKLVVMAGILIAPFLAIDRFASSDMLESARWSFFGLNHGALLVGALLAPTLLTICAYGGGWTREIGFGQPGPTETAIKYGAIAMVTGLLVWVMARGWAVAAVCGIGSLVLSAYKDKRLIRTYAIQFAFVLTTGALWMSILPPPSIRFYAAVITQPVQTLGIGPPTEIKQQSIPVLGEESCLPFRRGQDSVAMREVLYQEAFSIFKQYPLYGVGVANFGRHSCTGVMGYPHSTILQSLSETGLVGGGVLIGLLYMAASTVTRLVIFARGRKNFLKASFVLALLTMFFVADQIYGNYLMSVGTYFLLGLTSSMRVTAKKTGATNA